MKKNIEDLKKTRLYLLDLLKGLTKEQLNEIPAGFNNNIIWNLGHLVAAQQGVCYLRAGLKTVVEEKYLLPYKPGTKPEGFIDDDEVATLKKLLIDSIDQLQADYQNNLFGQYNKWTTRYGVDLAGIDDAIQFLSFHEGLHSGYIMAMKRCIKAL